MGILKRLWNWFFSDIAIEFDLVRIEQEVVEDICALAKSSWPKETIQFLTGDIRKENGKKVLVIDGLYLKSYQATNVSAHFSTHDLPMLGVFGTVHSHPSGNNRPSGADLQLFSRFGIVHLIIGAPYTQHTIAAYSKNGHKITVTYSSHGAHVQTRRVTSSPWQRTKRSCVTRSSMHPVSSKDELRSGFPAAPEQH